MSMKAIRPHKDEIIELLGPPHNMTQKQVITLLEDKYDITTSPSSITRLTQEALSEISCEEEQLKAAEKVQSPAMTEIRNGFQDTEMHLKLLSEQLQSECERIRAVICNAQKPSNTEFKIGHLFNRRKFIIGLCVSSCLPLLYFVDAFPV